MKVPYATKGEWFWDILFPASCLACGETLQYSKKEIFCPICRQNMVISDTHLIPNHPLKKRLNKEFPFHLTFSKYRFPNKSRAVSRLIYGLKYQNLLYIGHIEGEEYGKIISPWLKEHRVTGLIPTPLHWQKEIKRGYNQSVEFAKGLSRTTHLPIMTSILRRVKRTRSQTSLNKKERLKNMHKAFQAKPAPSLMQQTQPLHFLLIDDVITSGTTLSEMARTLRSVYPDCQCSICTLAYKDYG